MALYRIKKMIFLTSIQLAMIEGEERSTKQPPPAGEAGAEGEVGTGSLQRMRL